MDDASAFRVHDSSTAVIVPAAGSGRRMGGEKKQFRLLGNAPVLIRTLRQFAAHSSVDCLVVVVPSEETEEVRALVAEYSVEKVEAVVAGGATRQESVAAGLAVVPPACEVVLVHDAVRPFVTEAYISAVIEAVRKEGAGALAVPVADTVRRAEGEIFGETVEREGLYRMQTPQGSRAAWLREAHRQAREKGWQTTDEVALLQQAGFTVRLVQGSEDNFKITRPEDWTRAEWVFHAMGTD